NHILAGLRVHPLQLTLAICGILIQGGPAAGQTLVSRVEAESRWETVQIVEFGAMDLDVSHVTVIAPGTYEIRTRWRFASAQLSPAGHRYQASIAVRGLDCRRGEMALISFANHNGARVVDEESLPVYAVRWEPVSPESVVGKIATRVCGAS